MAEPAVLRPDGGVDFGSAQDYVAHHDAFLAQGAVLVKPERKVQPFESVSLALHLPGAAAPLPVKGEVASMMGDQVLIRLVDLDDAKRASLTQARAAALAGAAAKPPASTPSKAAPPTPAPGAAGEPKAPEMPADLHGTRRFRNPTDPREFLAMPLSRSPTPEEMASAPMPLLLRWLVQRKEKAVSVVVRPREVRPATILLVEGQEVRTSTPWEAAVKAFAAPAGEIEIKPVEPGRHPYSAQAGTFRFLVLKDLIKHHREEELAAAMSGHHGLSPRLTDAGATILPHLQLSDSQKRVARRMLDGKYTLLEVVHNGIGVRSTWHILYLLQVVGGLAWGDPPPRTSTAEELNGHLEFIRTADHFSALELHYTSSAASIERAYRRLQGIYGPGTLADEKWPAQAREIMRRIDDSYAAVRTAEGRKAYRAERWPAVRMDHAASVVHQQALMAEMRREFALAIDLLEAAIELDPSPEYRATLARFRGGARNK